MATKQPKSVRDYLDALVWDGVPRIDRWLVEYAGVEDSAYVRAVSRAFLIAAVRRVRQPGCSFDTMLVLEGAQGTGKSAALRILAISDDWFTDDVPMGSQDVIEATAGKWIVEMSEIEGMGQGDVAALKAFLSARVDVGTRPAYQREAPKVPRHFVIVGTTSAAEYLKDSTGNRRFWPVHVSRSFDLDRLRADRDQLWAEAAAAEAKDEPIEPIDMTPAEDMEEQYAYVVIDNQFGVEFSSRSLDAACMYVSTKLRKQAAETALTNPSSYRIKRVKAG